MELVPLSEHELVADDEKLLVKQFVVMLIVRSDGKVRRMKEVLVRKSVEVKVNEYTAF
jgi:hypothetical protein